MPKVLEEKLQKEAASKGLQGKRAASYIYGTMRNTGWKPGREQPKKPATKRQAGDQNGE